jgi:putative ABC transport system permease protein
VCETLLVGLLSLAAGLALGVFLSQGMAFLTAKLFGVRIARYAFVFSSAALRKSVRSFGIAFLMVILFNVFLLNRLPLLDLLYDGRTAARARRLPLWLSTVLFPLSLAVLGIAYYLVLHVETMGFFGGSQQRALLASIVLGLLGTLLFYSALSQAGPALLLRCKALSHKNLNLFTLRQFGDGFGVALALLCLLLFLSISAISVGTALSIAIRAYSERESGTATSISYMAFYIGMVFLLAGASMLAIGQLSRTTDNQSRYALLAKLGASEKQLASSLLLQIGLRFALPLGLALVHAIVGIKVASVIVEAIGDLDIYALCVAAGLLLVVVYGGYFVATYSSSLKLLRQCRRCRSTR